MKKQILSAILTVVITATPITRTFDVTSPAVIGASSVIVGGITYAILKSLVHKNTLKTNKQTQQNQKFFIRNKDTLISTAGAIAAVLGTYGIWRFFAKPMDPLGNVKIRLHDEILTPKKNQLMDDWKNKQLIDDNDFTFAQTLVEKAQEAVIKKSNPTTSTVVLQQMFNEEFEPFYTILKQQRAELRAQAKQNRLKEERINRERTRANNNPTPPQNETEKPQQVNNDKQEEPDRLMQLHQNYLRSTDEKNRPQLILQLDQDFARFSKEWEQARLENKIKEKAKDIGLTQLTKTYNESKSAMQKKDGQYFESDGIDAKFLLKNFATTHAFNLQTEIQLQSQLDALYARNYNGIHNN